jgi:preprotein translocase subunit SecA
MSDILVAPGTPTATPRVALPRLRLYPERDDAEVGWRRLVGSTLAGSGCSLAAPLRRARTRRLVRRVNARRAALAALDDDGFGRFVADVRRDLVRHRFRDDCVARAYAAIREAARRRIGLAHFDVQLQAGFALLHGAIAEQETGEGKTLTATLAAGTAALSGIPVHVVTVNDYLARRDEGLMGPVYRALGLSVGVVVSGMSRDERRAAYAADVTYCTNKEAAFDYLRDRVALGRVGGNLRPRLSRLFAGNGDDGTVMRGLHFAIIDEADSVLIDEARTPLIISDRTDPRTEQERAQEALRIVEPLARDEHFTLRRDNRQIELTERGKAALRDRAESFAGPWRGALYREEQSRNALSALHLFHRDVHYLVRDDRVEIIDENTGRVMPDRSWGEGLHQMIEVKEGCSVTGQTVPRARMTYQRFFRRYQRLAGMTGTAREARRELWNVYRLPVARTATNRPLARVHAPPRIFRTTDEKWQHIVTRTRALSKAGIPVLIGTRTVAASEVASGWLADAGIDHRVLNAAQDEHEAEIIAQAGQAGRVTVATNMAGRGVDIRLGAGVAERGGLHVIMSERHDSGRIDRQLFGRCARQGDPGCVEVVLSLDDSLLDDAGLHLPRWPATPALRGLAFRRAQRKMERRYSRARRELMRWDQRMGTTLAFSGRIE